VLTIQALARRPNGAARYLRLVEYFSGLLRSEAPRDECRPASTEEALVGGIATIVAEQLRLDAAQRLPALVPELVELTLVPYLGRTGLVTGVAVDCGDTNV
jgi:hypothetical protein